MRHRKKLIRTKLVSSLAVLLLLTLLLGGLIPVFASSQGEPDFTTHYKAEKDNEEYHVTRVLVERENVIVDVNFFGYKLGSEEATFIHTQSITYNITWMFAEERYNWWQIYHSGHKPAFFGNYRLTWRVEIPEEFYLDEYSEYYPTELGYNGFYYKDLNLGLPGVTHYVYNLYPENPNDLNYTPPPINEGGVQGEDEE